MKLNESRQAYYDASGKASDISRQLGFAGIAIVWLFRYDQDGQQTLVEPLIPATFLIVVALALDFLQYVVTALIWSSFSRWKEKRVEEDEEFEPSKYINWPALFFFWTKIVVMVFAYGSILRFLYWELVV